MWRVVPGQEYPGVIMKWSMAALRSHDEQPVGDQSVHLSGTFDDYEALLRMRGESSIPRIAYLEGNIVIVTPSREHEGLKSWIGSLVETWCLWSGKRYQKYGSWTLKDRSEERGAEPDECFVFDEPDPVRPHLAIEVVWTAIGVDKLEIYRRLQVQEVWIWRQGRISIHGLKGDRYELLEWSQVLPGIDVNELAQFLDRPTTYDAVMEYRARLESRPSGAPSA